MFTLTRRLLPPFLCLAVLASSVVLHAPVRASADSTFYVTGRGWGHGIGMSQYGARELANRIDARTGEQFTGAGIIRYYYGNTTRTKIESGSSKTMSVRIDRDANSSNLGYTTSSWTLRAGRDGSRLLIKAGNLPSAGITTPDDGWYKFTAVTGGMAVYKGSTRWSPGGVSVLTGTVTVSEVSSSPLVQVAQGTGAYDKSYGRYRGRMKIASNGSRLKLINYVALDQYLYGVVPREMPASWGDAAPAALDAQAIAARSYAYTSSGEIYCTTASQVYQGHSYGNDRSDTSLLEDSRTNAAVKRTAGKIARYYYSDGRVETIRTYFSSTSGAHTANIEDVWTGAVPKPYYKGVPDPDISSPYHSSWGDPISLSGTQFAAKLRAGSYTRNNAEPSPAYVTKTSITPASNGSGYAVKLTVTWSNGAQRIYTGDAIRNALGLRSTKFVIGKNYVPRPPDANGVPPAPPMTTYQQNDGRFAYVGPWKSSTSSIFSGGSRLYNHQAQSWFVASFTGTSVKWIGTTGTAYGIARVYLDGKHVKTVDLYRSKSGLKQTLFADYDLPAGPHVLEIRVLGTKNKSSRGTRVCVDAIAVGTDGELTKASPPIRRIDQNHSSLAWVGEWRESPVYEDVHGGTHRFTNVKGSKLYLSFHGTGFVWKGPAQQRGGLAKITIDGKTPVVVDAYAATVDRTKTIFAADDLAWGKHSVVIEVLGTSAPESDGATVSVDSIDIIGGIPLRATLPRKRIDDTSAAIEYTNTWSIRSSGYLHGGAEHRSKLKNSFARVSFDGTAVRWLGTKGPTSGRANVYIDGVYKKTVNLYASRTTTRQTLFEIYGLKSGKHVFQIKVLGAHSRVSKDSWISVDSVDIYGEPVLAP